MTYYVMLVFHQCLFKEIIQFPLHVILLMITNRHLKVSVI